MNQILNGRINEHGVIIPFNDTLDIIYNKAEDSLLYRDYRSGNVHASIRLAEFDGGDVACGSDVRTSYSGYSSPLTVSGKTERKAAIQKEMESIVRFLENVLAEENSCKSKSTGAHCRKVLAGIRADLCILSDCGVLRPVQEEPLTLPLVF